MSNSLEYKTFDDWWRRFCIDYHVHETDEKYEVEIKDFITLLEKAWKGGRNRYVGFVIYLIQLESKTPALAKQGIMKISYDALKRAMQNSFETGRRQKPALEID